MSTQVDATTMAWAGEVRIEELNLINTPNQPAYVQPPDNAQGNQTGQTMTATQRMLSRMKGIS